MNPTLDAFLRSWPSAPWLSFGLVGLGVVYFRGWRLLRLRDAERWNGWRLGAFLGGLAAIYLALASPLETFADLLLQVHMLQHLLLMMVAPPLLWLGWPLLPLIRGLPEPIRRYWAVPLFRSSLLRGIGSALTRPAVAWTLFVGMTWFWHIPRFYELAIRSPAWHVAEHGSFFAAALLFWFPVVSPYPARLSWPAWLLFPYLLLADVQNTLLAAWLSFSSRVLYPHYAEVPRVGGFPALEDQHVAGVLMWVPGSIAFLLPLVWIGLRYLFTPENRRRATGARSIERRRAASVDASTAVSARFDLLQLPFARALVACRWTRPAMQTVMICLALVMIVDGLRGPQVSPANLAGVLPWIHWRGLLVLGLLFVGNIFCTACPFTLPRAAARRWFGRRAEWPRFLRNKWLGVALVILFLWSYEGFSLWDHPWITAWIAIAYFAAAFAIDSWFRDGTYCKFVCPIGQFNFVQALVSPAEVSVRDAAVCQSCRTHECIRGSDTIAGCGLALYQPRKIGNFDCTFCLDCVRSCPHENVGVLAVVPGSTLWTDPVRSGIGRFSARTDIAALGLVLVFGAFANAAGMIAPVVEWQESLRAALGHPPRLVITTLFYAIAILVLPWATVRVAAELSRATGPIPDEWHSVALRYWAALVPLGFAMWLAHYSFHFFTSAGTIIPAAQRFAADFGAGSWGDPLWQCACCESAASWIIHLEVLMLDVGLLASLYTCFRIAQRTSRGDWAALRACWPWLTLITILFVGGVWILLQPMEMRGTLPDVGALP